MLTVEDHVTQARAFSEEMAVAKDKLVPDQDEVKASSDEKLPF